jgi:GT2 family glycosyltransferase
MLNGTGADYQLVLNPDVDVASDAIANAGALARRASRSRRARPRGDKA